MPKCGKPYYEKNKLVAVWLPETLRLWFLDYLQKYSYGDSTSQQFRNFLYELKSLDDHNVNFANARTRKEQEDKDLFEIRFGKVTEQDLICLRNLDRQKLSNQQRELSCGHCKDSQTALYKACQEIRAEYQKSTPRG